MGAARFVKSIAIAVTSMGALAGATNCALSKTCTDVGCSDGATVNANLPLGRQALYGATFTACFNATCATAVFGPPLTDGGPTYTFDDHFLALTGPLSNQYLRFDDDESGGTAVQFQLNPYLLESDGGVDILSVHDGDSYTMKIVGADGSTILDATRTTSYMSYQPNGADCDPTCHEAEIDVTP
jgi:hypothetical protein